MVTEIGARIPASARPLEVARALAPRVREALTDR